MLLGLAFAQPMFFAVWMVLGPGSTVKRIPLTLATFVVAMLASGLHILGPAEQRGKPDTGILVPGLALLAASAGAFGILRWRTGWRIRRTFQQSPCETATNQFSLKFLFICITICAVLLAAARSIIPAGVASPDRNTSIHMSISLGLVLLINLPTIVTSLVCLSNWPDGKQLLLLTLLWGALYSLAVETSTAAAAALNRMPQSRREIATTVILFQLGAMSAGLVCAVALRSSGYRLVGSDLTE